MGIGLICGACGAGSEIDARFCTRCGSKFNVRVQVASSSQAHDDEGITL
jgi:ribosomal protein L40E